MTALNVSEFGPPASAEVPLVVALHGLTGHGKRWRDLATNYLPDVRIAAPDLRGHGRSTWAPPWNLEQVATDVADYLARQPQPAALVGHSFGGAVALWIAHRHPELVRGVLLLDPAIQVDPQRCLDMATAAVRYPDYTDRDEALQEKLHDSWSEVDRSLIEQELDEHLVPLENGRMGWRMCTPAVGAYFGELAREFVLPPTDVPMILVQATKVDPAWVNSELREAVSRRGKVVDLDCQHSVPLARPAAVAGLVRELLQ